MHDKALTKKAQELFRSLHRFAGFYLVGGTALALQIGHRLSVDLDLFTQEKLPANLLTKVKRIFHDYHVIVTYRSPEQLNLVVNDVKMTFFQFPYPVVNEFIMFQEMAMADVQEIAAMKAFAIGKRLAYKDYIDWYYLLKEKHVDVQGVITLASKKFGADFNDR